MTIVTVMSAGLVLVFIFCIPMCLWVMFRFICMASYTNGHPCRVLFIRGSSAGA